MANRGYLKLRSWDKNAIETTVLSAKFCTSCRQHRPRTCGSYIVFNNGMNHRWICSECANRRKGNAAQTETRN